MSLMQMLNLFKCSKSIIANKKSAHVLSPGTVKPSAENQPHLLIHVKSGILMDPAFGVYPVM